jgi:hypothetical protein
MAAKSIRWPLLAKAAAAISGADHTLQASFVSKMVAIHDEARPLCSVHGSSGAQGDSTPTCGLTDTKRVWAAFRNPEGCQMVAGGRSGAATPGQLGGGIPGHPGGVPENGAAPLAPLRGAGHPRRRSGGLAWLRPPATLFHPSGMNGLTVASLGFREGVAHRPSQIRVRSRATDPHFIGIVKPLLRKHPKLATCHSTRLCDFLVWTVGRYKLK